MPAAAETLQTPFAAELRRLIRARFPLLSITTGLSEYVTTTGTEWGTMAAIAIITLVPALIVFSVVQRHIVAGLTFGAVKE